MTQLEQFREEVYEQFLNCADASMDLLDALTANTTARSVVELSLNAPFRRSYGSVYTAINGFFQPAPLQDAQAERRVYNQRLTRILTPYLPVPAQRPFWLFGLDVTPAPRPFARTLADRSFVYQPNTIWGNKPIAIGHQYATLALLPEKVGSQAPPWIVPVSTRRVDSAKTGTQVGVEQVADVFFDETLPFAKNLCVQVGGYSLFSSAVFRPNQSYALGPSGDDCAFEKQPHRLSASPCCFERAWKTRSSSLVWATLQAQRRDHLGTTR